MRNIKISTRLALGFGFFIVVILVVAGLGAWRTLQSMDDNRVAQDNSVINSVVMEWARNVEVNGERTLMVAGLADENIKAVLQQRMRNTSEEITNLQNRVDGMLTTPGARDLFKKVLDARQAYTQQRAAALADEKNGAVDKAQVFFKERMPGLLSDYRGSIDDLFAFQDDYQHQLFERGTSRGQATLGIVAALAAISLLFGLLLSWRVSRSITRPLQKAVHLASAVADRHLDHDITPQGRDEITELERALSKMVTGLSDAVLEVRTGANSIASAAAQITAGNLDLSSRTEQQASSLAETAATMEQITATVRQNADNVQQANTLAASASRTATEGGTLVKELVGTMGEINEKSRQVADIIGVIDSIAFQTNILALNAAVEAARAGEQGRGFAVVASEVRALAQRSASAAKEIKGLIDASVQSTSRGNDQASHAGATMQDIVEGITRVTDIMGEISAANREQTTGIEEINTAVTQMDDVTRQNASLVEESAAAAGSLQGQADTLARLVESFQLADGGIVMSPAVDSVPAAEAPAARLAETAAGPRRAPPRLPAVPEKLIAPTPQQIRGAEAAVRSGPAAAQPALRAPSREVVAETEEWAEF